MAKRLLPTPEVRGLIPDISKVFIEKCLLSTVLKRQNKEKKRPGVAHFLTVNNSVYTKVGKKRQTLTHILSILFKGLSFS